MITGKFRVPVPVNEPAKSYAPGSSERALLKSELKTIKAGEVEIPCIIGGKEVRTGSTGTCVHPHDHGNVIGRHHKAGEKEVRDAVDNTEDDKGEFCSSPGLSLSVYE